MSRAQSSGNSFSSVSSLTSVSSVREEPFKEHVRDIKTGPTALETLVEHATFLIDKLAANEEKDTYQGGSTVQLHAVLRAMLVHADGCSGKQGTRYTAAAIWACVVQDDTESADTLQMLHDLAETWALISYSFVSASDMPMIYLSYIVKFNRSHSAQQNRTPSEAATPSRDLTAMSMDRGVTSKARPASFKDQYDTAVTTFDILRNYANLSQEALSEKMSSMIDDPSNGFLLDLNAYAGFDRFQWCLQQTEVDDMYIIEIYGNVHGIPGKASKVVEFDFEDHSEEFRTNRGRRKRAREIPLPDRHYIRLLLGCCI